MEPKEAAGVLTLRPVAWYRGLLPEKFGLPRQSGLVPELTGRVEMAEGFREREAFRGLEGFSHVWLIWGFSGNHTWSPTVRPPRLGGNTRLGVFATRSPFRPNPLGLSLVELEKIAWDGPQGPEIWVKGADLMDGTPIYDIKPYVPYADALPEDQRGALLGILAQDPRPHYQKDPDRVYGMAFGQWNVKFRITEGIVYVISLENA